MYAGEIAVEAFTCLLMFKNIFSFGLTWGAYNWLVSAGISKTFYIIASIQVGICLLSIPMCKSSPSPFGTRLCQANEVGNLDIFGKWNRAFFSRHDILKLCHL